MEDFFKDLASLKDQGWHIKLKHLIRNKYGYCPLEAIYILRTNIDPTSKPVGYLLSETAQKTLGLYNWQILTIINSSDNTFWMKNYNKNIRRRILDTLGCPNQ